MTNKGRCPTLVIGIWSLVSTLRGRRGRRQIRDSVLNPLKTLPRVADRETAVQFGAFEDHRPRRDYEMHLAEVHQVDQTGQLPSGTIGQKNTPSVVHLQPLTTATFTRGSQAAIHIVYSAPIDSPATPIRSGSTSGLMASASTQRNRSQSAVVA